jgi:signal transduction histidine kinase
MNRLIRFLVYLLFALLLWPADVQAQARAQLVNLTQKANEYSIGEQLEIFEDTSAELTLQDIQQLDSLFKPGRQKRPNFGLSTSAIWCKLRVSNQTNKEWYLEVGTPYLHEVSLYQMLPGKKFRKVQVSSAQDFTRRPVQSNLFILPLHAPAHREQIYYLRVRSHFILDFPLRIATLQRVYEDNLHIYIRMGLYFGLLLTLIVYNLFVYIAIRDHTYLYYIAFLVANGLYVAYTSGFGLAYLYPHQPWLNQSNYYGAAAQLLGVVFTHSFLQIRKHVPELRLVSWIIVSLSLCVVAFSLAGQVHIGFRLLVVNVILISLYVYVMGIALYRKGFKPALYYMLAFTVVNTGVLIYCLQNLMILPQNNFTGNAYMIGSSLEAIVLSFALASKLNTFKEEKEQAQLKAIEQATAFSRQLIHTQEQERKRIAAELHDSVGQSLSLIKNRLLLLQESRQAVLPATMQDLTQSVGQTLQEVRTISYALRPVQLELLGFTRAIKHLIEETASASNIHFYEDVDNVDDLFAADAEINLYRILQECLSNMVRHAQATAAKVLLSKSSSHVILQIQDNGVGINATPSKPGTISSGLPGIRERLQLLSGTLELTQATPQGTLIYITIPIK